MTRNYTLQRYCISNIFRWLTTANGYLRLLLFDEELTTAQSSNLISIASYVLSVYAPMFFRIHLNPRAPEGPANMIFLRDLLLDLMPRHKNLVENVVKPIFLKHFIAWMNPTNVALNTHAKQPAFHIKHLQDIHQILPVETDTRIHGWRRTPLRSFYTSSSKEAPCVKLGNKCFWTCIDNHNRTCERYIGRMSQCLLGGKIRDAKTKEGRWICESEGIFLTVQDNH